MYANIRGTWLGLGADEYVVGVYTHLLDSPYVFPGVGDQTVLYIERNKTHASNQHVTK